MSDLALRGSRAEGWAIRGQAQIDERPAAPCVLIIRLDGTWSAEVATFTLAGEVDLLFVSSEGGQFCGPAAVMRSRADSGLAMQTELLGVGPLLVVAPSMGQPELEDEEMLEGEVVE